MTFLTAVRMRFYRERRNVAFFVPGKGKENRQLRVRMYEQMYVYACVRACCASPRTCVRLRKRGNRGYDLPCIKPTE